MKIKKAKVLKALKGTSLFSMKYPNKRYLLVADSTIDLTLAEVGKVNEKFIKKLKEKVKSGKLVTLNDFIEEIDNLAKEQKQKLGIEVLK